MNKRLVKKRNFINFLLTKGKVSQYIWARNFIAMRFLYSSLLIAIFLSCSTKSKSVNEPEAQNENLPIKEAEFKDLPIGAQKKEFTDVPGLVGILVGSQAYKTATGHYLKGKRTGTWVQYYPNGLVMSITSYVNGQKEGICMEMGANNNQLKKIYYYHQGQREGEYKEYNATNIKEERTYVNGKIEGTTKVFYDNSKIMEVGSYKNGLRDGISKWYDQDGKLGIEYEYKNGQLVKK